MTTGSKRVAEGRGGMFVDGVTDGGCASTNKNFRGAGTMAVCRSSAGRRHRHIIVGLADMAAERAAGVNGAMPLVVAETTEPKPEGGGKRPLQPKGRRRHGLLLSATVFFVSGHLRFLNTPLDGGSAAALRWCIRLR